MYGQISLFMLLYVLEWNAYPIILKLRRHTSDRDTNILSILNVVTYFNCNKSGNVRTAYQFWRVSWDLIFDMLWMAGKFPTQPFLRAEKHAGLHVKWPLLMMFFWVLTPYRLVGRCQSFGETYCLHLQGWQLLLSHLNKKLNMVTNFITPPNIKFRENPFSHKDGDS
jgi:hypothetical protein